MYAELREHLSVGFELTKTLSIAKIFKRFIICNCGSNGYML